MSTAKKNFMLPSKKVAVEAANPLSGADLVVLSGGGPVSRTRLRTDFEEQAKRLKEVIALGPTPVRIEKPKNETSLNSKGVLKGEVQTLEPTKGKEERPNLIPAAKTVYEQAKRLVFAKRAVLANVSGAATESGATSQEFLKVRELAKQLGLKTLAEVSTLVGDRKNVPAAELIVALEKKIAEKDATATESKAGRLKAALAGKVKSTSCAPIKDESESTDPQPKEAVAFEGETYNRRERNWLANKDVAGITAAMDAGNLAKVRGKQLLAKLRQPSVGSATEAMEIPKASDMGKPIEDAVAAESVAPVKVAPEKGIDPLLGDKPANVVDTPESYGIVEGVTAIESAKGARDKLGVGTELIYSKRVEAFPGEWKSGKFVVVSINPDGGEDCIETSGGFYTSYADIAAGEKAGWLKIKNKAVAAEQVNALVARIDTEVGDDLGLRISYESQLPIKGQVIFGAAATEDVQNKAHAALESLGLKVRQLPSKEAAVLEFKEEKDVPSANWWALVATDSAKTTISQIALSSPQPIDKESIQSYLEQQFGAGSVYQISAQPIER